MQVYETPDVDLPIAPAGAQNAPGVTISELLVATGEGVGVISGAVETVGVGVGVMEGELTGIGVTTGVAGVVGIALTIGVGVGVAEVPRLQELTKEFNFVASFASTVKEYLTFIAIQFSI